MVKMMLESVRQEVDRELDQLKGELLTASGRETRVEIVTA